GEERGTSAEGREKFGTYTRDSSGLDYADQRYYGVGTGRFGTPDPYKASAGVEDPSSWNRYSYVTNDPITFGDPEGLDKTDFVSCSAGATCFSVTGTAPSPGTSGPGTISIGSRDAIGGDYDVLMPVIGGEESAPDAVGGTGSYVECDPGMTCFSTTVSATQQGGIIPLVGQPPHSFYIDPNASHGPRVRIFGPTGRAMYDIDYQNNGPSNPHIHRWNGPVRSHPGEPVPPGSRIPSEPIPPPGARGPYSPWPRRVPPTIGAPAPLPPGSSIIIVVNPCLMPGIGRMLPGCRTGPMM
ncbi:MAG: hypothetical protein JST11_31190, partial [Acidobacteria bacterium]|nr:hypothetical protein [Acidobacteriota bacterium]